MPKPDDRSDNVEKLQTMIQSTMENMRETHDYLSAHRDEISNDERSTLEAKNQRREAAIQGFREEIKDEAHYSQ